MNVLRLSVGLLSVMPIRVVADEVRIVENPVTGAITNLEIVGDETAMNWVHAADGSQYAWIGPRYGWGTGTFKVNGRMYAWLRPGKTESGVEVIRTRRLVDGVLEEQYVFRNTSNHVMDLSEIDIHTPFNDNYPNDSSEMFKRRCHAHVWPGGAAGWVAALRIGGFGPHLGLVITEGALAAYEQKERGREKGMSNVRGVIALSPEDARLAPGEETMISWKVFAHAGWEDFFKRAVELGGAWVESDRYVARKGEIVSMTAKTKEGVWMKKWQCPGLGDYRVPITFGAIAKRISFVEVHGIEDPESILLARARYIVKHQQVNEPGSPYDGAFVPYDPNLGKQERRWLPEWQRIIGVDHSEGGERMGMGVFLAMMAQRGYTEFAPAVFRYYSFMRNHLQEPNYVSWQDVARPSRKRAFNYPWFIRFYLELYGLTGNGLYLDDAWGTFRRLFSGCVAVPDCLVEFQIGRLVTALRESGRTADADEAITLLRKYLTNSATFDVENIVTHEVMISPDMVSGAFGQLLDFYVLTGERFYIKSAEKWLPIVEAIAGRQPSWHAHDIGMHHWNGYWFGRFCHWGDTLPHDWNGHLATAFHRYAVLSGKSSFDRRSKGIADAMLGLFYPDGRATCAWIYTDRVNGEQVKGPDPLMNDQDWALVYYLENNLKREIMRSAAKTSFLP